MAKISGVLSKSVWLLVLVSGICFVRGLEAETIFKADLSDDSANSLFREEIISPNDESSLSLTNKEPKNGEEIVQLEENEKIPANVEALKSAELSENGARKISTKQIIDAPSKQCPPGQRKDKNGRCRVILN